MIVKINKVQTSYKDTPSFVRNIYEDRDTGTIIVKSTRKSRYEPYTFVDVTTPDEQYLVQGDEVIRINASEYEHTITLTENISYFDTIYPADRAFKIIGQTLGDILLVYKRELSTYHGIEIDYSTMSTSELDEVISFREYTGANFSSILTDLFRKIWAVPKVNRISATWDIYPLYHNERNSLISTDTLNYKSKQSSSTYATKLKSQLKNAVNERSEDETAWFPSENGYVLPRSKSLEKISSNLRYELDSEIVFFYKAVAVDINYKIYNNTTGFEYYTAQNIDISDYIVEQEVYDGLPIITSTLDSVIAESDNIKNHVRYKLGERYITDLYTNSDPNSTSIFTNDIEYLINAIRRKIKTLYDETEYGAVLFTDSLGSGITLLTKDIKMRFKYIGRRNMDILQHRKTRGNMIETTDVNSQISSSVEIGEYKKSAYNFVNRMGNDTYSYARWFDLGNEFSLFDYTDNKSIVTQVKNTYYPNDKVYCEFEVSENFANIIADYALLRTGSPYTITGKSVTTNLILTDYISFDFTDLSDTSRLTSDAQRLLLGLFETTTMTTDKVSGAVFIPESTGWNSSHGIYMPAETDGDANLITMHVQFNHQLIAGKIYYDLDTSTYTDQLRPLFYTENQDATKTDGTLENYQLYFVSDVLFEDLGQYPLILDQTNYLAAKLTNSGITYPLDLDQSAAFALTYQANFVANEDIFIGNSLSTDNYLIKDQLTSSSIKIYDSLIPYNEYVQTPRTSDTDITSLVSYNYSHTDKKITITPTNTLVYFAIVKDDKVLISVNKVVSAGVTLTIYINFLQELTNNLLVELSTSLVFTANDSYDTFKNFSNSAITTAGVSMNDSYTVSPNDFINASITAGITPTDSYIVQKFIRIEKDLVITAGITPSDSYIVDANKSLNQTTTAGINPSDSYIVQKQTIETLNQTTTAGLNPSDSYSTDRPVEWVSTTTTTTVNEDCLTEDDIGNLKREVASCSFVENGDPYTSLIDKTNVTAPCSDGASRIICLPDGQGAYSCQKYVGELSYNYFVCALEE